MFTSVHGLAVPHAFKPWKAALVVLVLLLLPVADLSALDSWYNSPMTRTVTVDPGSETFTINNVNNKHYVNWHVSNNQGGSWSFKERDNATWLDGDLDYRHTFAGSEQWIRAQVRHDDGGLRETHLWKVKIRRPNLVVTNIWTVPNPLHLGDRFEIRATVKNIGNAKAYAGLWAQQEAVFYVNGEQFGEGFDYDSLEAGHQITVSSRSLTVESFGTFTFKVVADGNGEVEESDETDNARSEDHSVVEPPDPWEDYVYDDDLAARTLEGIRHDSDQYRYHYARFGVMVASDHIIIPGANANLDSGRGASISGDTDDYFLMAHGGGGTGAQPERCFTDEGILIPWDTAGYDIEFQSDGEVTILDTKGDTRYYLFRKLHVSPANLKSVDQNRNLTTVSATQPFTTRGVVIVIHGWNAHAYANMHDSETGDVAYRAQQWIEDHDLADDWQAMAYDWSIDANTGGTWSPYPGATYAAASESVDGADAPMDAAQSVDSWPIQNATEAAESALLHGRFLGELIAASGVEEVQFVAHSAGSWVARTAAAHLATDPTMKVQVTLLDPFMPREGNADSLLGKGVMGELDTYTAIAYLENYYTTDFNTDTLGSGSTSQTFAWGGKPSYQFDLNRVDFGTKYRTHAGPVEFYADSINGSVTPYGWWADHGFDYTQWGWNNSLPYAFLLERLLSQRRIGFTLTHHDGSGFGQVLIERQGVGDLLPSAYLETRDDGHADDNGVNDPGSDDDPRLFEALPRLIDQQFGFASPANSSG